MKNILLIRHGQSEWNKLNLFTGFKNVELSEQGIEEANKAGQNFKKLNLKFDLVFTSELKRAQDTAKIILENLDQLDDLNSKSKIIESFNLNERDYGDLTGLDKKETAEKFGDEQVHKWRRGYSDQPPNGESLEDVVNRVKTYFDSDILPSINNSENNNILIAAHGNSLRALLIVMKIYSSNDINSVELSTGIPIHIHFEDNLFSIKS
ncbi:MAG: 2,3-bisphosphoglycerate-dependent phosphoglycerate mutase [Alphaproteobacteria bacterium]|jgi:2,3-bisphosphoglycerate-dependent phosphoglycerate mutase|nr:2,3-bisphosphoglycerate-dependent phosphoglycerate mutase [Alphaproteobacteria bacterium]OUX22981.1 MAG: 2,3-bisphosphoglycerate-dependent phosphoglycerate mutase [Pelagibacteraceae bacterium TMED259]MDB2636760.1 2,3-bisphosphoglycerate-dependent phosphoglycerate mutase [Alphaproteobacteria bacterium]MDB3864075.1 2,3-bisphosphoglycerate-dependent phosphoglycerate mutase [Alphaproteobacteria bacterium]MDC0968653.1 2,3-bisphosphoglycerate-dependent phosphoglycerate mutase [Alphaproteobacteria |tara:strand:+ start:705 stop:1328 length:624 start_codon:yes stop_codon:yes gene_type:complete